MKCEEWCRRKYSQREAQDLEDECARLKRRLAEAGAQRAREIVEMLEQRFAWERSSGTSGAIYAIRARYPEAFGGSALPDKGEAGR